MSNLEGIGVTAAGINFSCLLFITPVTSKSRPGQVALRKQTDPFRK